MRAWTILTVGLLSAASWGQMRASAADTDIIDFNRDIRPILSDICFQCHGPDPASRQADLRLDLQQEIFKDRDGYAAVVPGKPAESELFRRVSSDDPDSQMPPADFKKQLTAEQKELFRQWIEQGAKWEGHWAYQPVTKPAVPEAEGRTRNEIDRFVLRKLKEKNLAQSPPADKRTLVRRLYLDLTGLPPTPEQVERFLKNDSPQAYDKLVDELLESPHYGERMAMYWLDIVRYADTNGIHGDNHREHWLYRDYVIDAFNRNKPFDQFTIEQLAGDLLPEASREQKIASGYNRLLLTTQEGGAQPKEYIAKYAADRVRNVGSAWLGSTVMCCECHDHKYDPFSQRDFYSLGAFFADIQEIAVGTQVPSKMPTAEQSARLAEFDQLITALNQKLQTLTPDLQAAMQSWEETAIADLKSGKIDWFNARPAKVTSAKKTKFEIQDDASVLTSGPNPAKETYTVVLDTDLPKLTGLRLEALTHPSFGNKSLSRANGNFVLTGFEVSLQKAGSKEKTPVKIASAVADFSQGSFPIEHAIDADPNTGWAVEGWQKSENRTAVFIFEAPLEAGPGSKLVVTMKHESPHAGHNIGRFRLALTQVDKPSLNDQGGLSADVVAILQTEPAERSDEQKKGLAAHFLKSTPMLDGVRKELTQAENARKSYEASIPELLISIAGEPRTMRVLPRGNWLDETGPEVVPAVPGFLPGLPASESRASRRDLAEWLVSKENPLTSRVLANRLWALFFGRGLVPVLDDFGSQSAPPTHPQLLDWLANDLMENGWDVKRAVKQIVLSETYRQSSYSDAVQRNVDPFNQWLARQGRFRIDAETIRDQALAVSGLMVDQIGGPSVKPYQPAGYWSHLNFPKREWENDKGLAQYRRGLYTYWCRTFLHPSMKAFDATSREECTVSRPRSNTPLQALVLLNDPTYVESSRKFAERAVRDGGESPESKLNYLYESALARPPRPEESQILLSLYEKHRAEFATEPAAADELLKVGQSAPVSDMDKVELAAWTSVARTILNLHETITRY